MIESGWGSNCGETGEWMYLKSPRSPEKYSGEVEISGRDRNGSCGGEGNSAREGERSFRVSKLGVGLGVGRALMGSNLCDALKEIISGIISEVVSVWDDCADPLIAFIDDDGVSCEHCGLSTGDATAVSVASVQSVADTEGREVVVSAEFLRGRDSFGFVGVTVIIIEGVTAVMLEVWLRHSGSRSLWFGRIIDISEPMVLNPVP